MTTAAFIEERRLDLIEVRSGLTTWGYQNGSRGFHECLSEGASDGEFDDIKCVVVHTVPADAESIEEALERIELGLFGRCSCCNQPIQPGRLFETLGQTSASSARNSQFPSKKPKPVGPGELVHFRSWTCIQPVQANNRVLEVF